MKKLRAHLAITIANVIYAANFTIAKEVMPVYVQPYAFILIRVLGALALYWLLAMIWVKEKIQKKDLPRVAMLGFFGVAVNQLLFFRGLNLSTPINASIMMITTPILVLVIAHYIASEKITFRRLAGIIIGFTGAVMLLLMKGNFSFGSETAEGDLCVLINAVAFAIYLVMARPLMQRYHTFTLVKWVFLFGLLFVLPFGYPQMKQIEWGSFSPYIWYCLLFVVIATTFIAYLFNTYALKELSSSVVSAYIYLQPLLASLIAMSFGKDHLSLIKIVSALLIFTGVYLSSRHPEVRKNEK